MSNQTTALMSKYISRLVHSEAVIEGVGCTFEQADNIVHGRDVIGLADWQVQIVKNLEHAWDMLFNCCDEFVDVNIIKQYNLTINRKLDSGAGKIRSDGATFVDTHFGRYFPPASSNSAILQAINTMWDFKDEIDKSLAILALLAKGQFFSDGNKRTAQLVANHVLALADAGTCFCVPENEASQFKLILETYYMDENDLRITTKELSKYLFS